MYTFPQDKENTPYRIRIPFDSHFGAETSVTLRKVKEHMPKKDNNYRFYFKASIDGEQCFEEETNENVVVPTFENKIIVQCRNC